MAFIREYSLRDTYGGYGYAGDPFSLRRPKWLRKIKPGRALGKIGRGVASLAKRVVPVAAGFIPGVGGLASKLFGIAQQYGVSPDVATEFARSYGIDLGDPDDYDELGYMTAMPYGGGDPVGWYGDPTPRPAKKRKAAGAGPAAKAKKKRDARATRSTRRVPGSVGTAAAKGIAGASRVIGAAASHLPGILGAAGEFLKGQQGPGDAEDAAMAAMAAAMGGKKGKGMPGAKRRTMNPANVRALRRGIRRLEGFQHLVKRVYKQFPTLRGGATMHAASPRRSKGHRAGCGCVVCKRRAA